MYRIRKISGRLRQTSTQIPAGTLTRRRFEIRSSASTRPKISEKTIAIAAISGLVLYNSSVLAEIMRAGILSLPRGQSEAALALGLSYRQSMRQVILPQGLRRMVPATVSQLITLNKDTTLVSIIAITEVMRRGRIVTSSNFFAEVQAPVLHVFLFIGFLFVLVNYGLSRLSRRLEVGQQKRTGTRMEEVKGLEDQQLVTVEVR